MMEATWVGAVLQMAVLLLLMVLLVGGNARVFVHACVES